MIAIQVKSEIYKRLATSRRDLEKLGAKRETTVEQTHYLLQISTHFQEITALAVTTNYVGCDWFDEYSSLRFLTAVVNRNELLAENFQRYGHSYEFKVAESNQNKTVPALKPESYASGSEMSLEAENRKEQISLRTTEDHVDLEELMYDQNTACKEINSDTLNWLMAVYKTSRGFELGTFDASLLAMTMKTQSYKWEGLALGYISDVVSMAHTFIIDLLRLVCPEARVREGLMSLLMDELMAKYKSAFDHVHFLLGVERTGTPTTYNHYFNDSLEKWFVLCFPIVHHLLTLMTAS